MARVRDLGEGLGFGHVMYPHVGRAGVYRARNARERVELRLDERFPPLVGSVGVLVSARVFELMARRARGRGVLG